MDINERLKILKRSQRSVGSLWEDALPIIRIWTEIRYCVSSNVYPQSTLKVQSFVETSDRMSNYLVSGSATWVGVDETFHVLLLSSKCLYDSASAIKRRSKIKHMIILLLGVWRSPSLCCEMIVAFQATQVPSRLKIPSLANSKPSFTQVWILCGVSFTNYYLTDPSCMRCRL